MAMFRESSSVIQIKRQKTRRPWMWHLIKQYHQSGPLGWLCDSGPLGQLNVSSGRLNPGLYSSPSSGGIGLNLGGSYLMGFSSLCASCKKHLFAFAHYDVVKNRHPAVGTPPFNAISAIISGRRNFLYSTQPPQRSERSFKKSSFYDSWCFNDWR